MSSIDNSAIRLICFPHAGGSSRTYIPWKQYASFLEIVTVPLPGRNFPTGSQTPTNFAELSEALMHHVRQMVNGVPYALFGHSMGALLAYEVTRLIEKAAARLPMAVFVSGCRSPQRWTQHGCRSSWTDSYILSNLVELGVLLKSL
ncbi:thioesterase II family protein [Burkholderia sp. Ed8]|uniref:thioesterase II family protein n=1 Tax=Burkholderia sp. Ed8 TaxID=3112957 RepID=UPI00345D97A5